MSDEVDGDCHDGRHVNEAWWTISKDLNRNRAVYPGRVLNGPELQPLI